MPMDAPINPQTPIALLGGLSPAQFMRKYWQKKPLLIRQAIPDVTPPVSRVELFKLAGQSDVESRLVVQSMMSAKKQVAPQWTLQHGPLRRRTLPPLSQPGWTVLVQGLDHHVLAARALLSQFRFVPEARLDDLMISWATSGGGVGPHADSYDVFLLQVHGRRRWQIGRVAQPEHQAGVPLKILTNFVPEQSWVLEPGDMLYLPPQWAHDGVAEDECMTCSIGFRAPGRDELVAEILGRLADVQGCEARLYQDPGLVPTQTPGRIPEALSLWAIDGVRRAIQHDDAIALALGEALTEPKPGTSFPEADVVDVLPVAIDLDRRSRMLYDEKYVYLNGASWRVGGRDARLLRTLADHRCLTRSQVAEASAALQAWIQEALDDGWIRLAHRSSV